MRVSLTKTLFLPATVLFLGMAFFFSQAHAAVSRNAGTVDSTPPVFKSITIASNGPTTNTAYAGDTVTLSLTASESINPPVVTLNGRPATVINIPGVTKCTKTGGKDGTTTCTTPPPNIDWEASIIMGSSEPVGLVSLKATPTDTAGNAGTTITTTTNGSNISFSNYVSPSPLYCLWSNQFTVSPQTYNNHQYILDPNCEPTAIISFFTAKTIAPTTPATNYTLTTKSNDNLYIHKNCGFLGFSCNYNLRVETATATSTSGSLPAFLRPGESIALGWQCQAFQNLLWRSKSTSFWGWSGDSDIRNKVFQFSTISVGTGFDTGGALSGSATVTPDDTTKYKLSCGGDGYVLPEIEIRVDNPKGRIVATPSTISPGGSTVLVWAAKNIKDNSCSVVHPSGDTIPSSQANLSPVGGLISGPVSGDLGTPVFFTLTCERYTGEKVSWKSNPVELTNKCLTAPDPTQPNRCSFNATTPVLQGGDSTLSWACPDPSTTYAIDKQETAGGPWGAIKSGSTSSKKSGTLKTNPLLNTTYRLTCGGGSTVPGVGVAAVTVNQPDLILSAAAYEIPVGGKTKITWSAQNVDTGSTKLKASGSNAVISSAASNLSGLTIAPAKLPATYTLTGTTPASRAGTAPAPSTSIIIYENGKGPRVLDFHGEPPSVRRGNASTLFWSGTNLSASCTLSSNPVLPGFPKNVSSTPTGNATGIGTGPIQQKTEFRLVCGPTGLGAATITIIPVFQEI